ncbi:MAG TPA: hypothetical protein VFC07_07425 [Verrucomicrobiae bacterium]|nr:hypothetical protein [Verrucomicrobiae bacterium]
MNWTLEYNGVEKTLADFGLAQVRRTLVSQGIDELTFRAVGAAADAAPLFPYKATVTLWRDRQRDSQGDWSGGTTWFQGLVTQVPRNGSLDAESMAYKVSGPWWYLENLVFLQAYQQILLGVGAPPGNPVIGSGVSSHLFMNLDSLAPVGPTLQVGKLTTGQQILAALDWCLAPFLDANTTPPFQIGRITPGVDVPIDEVRDITCAEVIHKMLRWSPDAVAYFDYTTMPPTFNCLRRAEMAVVNLDASQT